jgi:hypothetical protein
MSFWRIHPLDITSIVAGIDQEIARLSQARALLAGQTAGKKRGRPAGSVANNGSKVAKRAGKGMSDAGRARLSAAMKARWAAKKKAATKKAA